MKEYKVVQVVLIEQAENVMNHMARDGWVVISTAVGGNRFIITFERDIP